jgi:hypothetical protein
VAYGKVKPTYIENIPVRTYLTRIGTMWSRDSSVGIATCYGLDGPGVESRWGRCSPPVHTGSEVHPASYTMGTGSVSGVKRQGRGVDHPPPSTVEVKARVDLNFYSPSRLSWPVIG